jgi:SSS family solute:Na+ symporter
LHSWGSIFAQDVVLPFRKKPLSRRAHFLLLRLSIVFIAVFSYFFGLLFPSPRYILMFFALTGAIFLGGSGAVIIGGFYWRKGTTPGAYAGMITGSIIAIIGILLDNKEFWRQVVPKFLQLIHLPQVAANLPSECPVNGQWIYLFSMIAAIAVYVVVSLLTCREDFNLDRVLHRGKWAVKEYDFVAAPTAVAREKRSWLEAMLGIDQHFSRWDRFQTYVIFGWTMFWFVVFVLFSAWNLVHKWPTAWWATYWHIVGIWFPLAVGVITTVWFTIGGLHDLRILFRRLDEAQKPAPIATPADAEHMAGMEAISAVRIADPEAPVS